jgi:hypothetical protein
MPVILQKSHVDLLVENSKKLERCFIQFQTSRYSTMNLSMTGLLRSADALNVPHFREICEVLSYHDGYRTDATMRKLVRVTSDIDQDGNRKRFAAIFGFYFRGCISCNSLVNDVTKPGDRSPGFLI